MKHWAHELRTEVTALSLAGRDPDVPVLAKIVALAVAGYALSPIDLIPDFIPVLGYLDDLLIIPLGIALTVKLIPGPVMARLRREAEAQGAPPASKIAAILFIATWIAIGLYVTWLLLAYD